MFDFWLAKNWLKKLSMLRLFKRPNFNFMAIRYQVFAVTAIITISSRPVYLPARSRRPEHRLVGGVAYSGELNQPVSIDELPQGPGRG